MRPDRGRAGEARRPRRRGAPRAAARPRRRALHDVEHARRQARLGGEARERERRLRRVLGGLQHRRVAAQQRGEDLPGDVGDRRVGGDDQAGDAERLADVIAWRFGDGAGGRAAVEAPALAGHEVAHLDRAAGLAARVLRRLAGLGGDDRGDLARASRSSSWAIRRSIGAALGDGLARPGGLRGARRPPRRRRRRAASRARDRDSSSPVAGASFSKSRRSRAPALARRRSRCRRSARSALDAHAVKPPSTRSSWPVT